MKIQPLEPLALPATDMTKVVAEGAVVGFSSCLICGAALMADPRESDSVFELHAQWHAAIERGWGR